MEYALAGKNIFITGSGGTGKSMLISDLKARLENTICKGLIGMTAMTGCAATITGGQTLHSLLGLTPKTYTCEDIVNKVRGSKYLYVWQLLKVLIIDEVSMLEQTLFENLNKVAKALRRNQAPFGGIQLILAGDFYQLPPIKVKKFLFEAECWSECIDRVCCLTEVHRQSNLKFQQFLAACRLGQVTKQHLKYSKTFGLKDLKEDPKEDPKDILTHLKLFCRNVDVDHINQIELERLAKDNPVRTYFAKVTYINNAIQDPFKECPYQKALTLCKGVQVLLFKNSINEGLVNGSQGIVESFTSTGYPLVTFETKKGLVSKVIMDHELELVRVNELGKCAVSAKVSQLPLRLAYAITVHKSQGMTLDKVEIDLNGIFEYGQAYVALSRAKSHYNLSLKNFTCRSCKAHPKVIKFYENLES
jgi:ATP-dependent DNA helicase PIF1